MLPHVLDGQGGDLACRWAGEDVAVGCHGELLAPPASHARFGVAAVVVGDDVDNLHLRHQVRALRGRWPRLAVAAPRLARAWPGCAAPSRSTVLAGSSRSAPSSSASTRMAPTWSMLWRCRTTFRVSGKPSALTSRAAAIFRW